MSQEPEYILCVNCETPCYDFEYTNDKLVSAMCAMCGNDNPDDFMTEAEFDEG